METPDIIEFTQGGGGNPACSKGFKPITKERFLNVDFLRFLFAVVIVVFHFCHAGKWCFGQMFSYIKSVRHFSSATASGNLAVDFFFIISGFFLLFTFNNSSGVYDFMKKKIIRLWPMVAAFAGIETIYHYFVYHTPDYIPYNQILRILMIDNIGLNIVHSGITWYVSVLFWISLLFFYIIKNFSKKIVDLIVPVSVVICYAFLIHIFKGNVTGHTDTRYFILNAGVMRGIAGIGTGYLIYNFLKTVKPYVSTFKKFLCYTAAEGLLLFFVVNNVLFHKIKYNSNFVIIVGFVWLFILFLLKRGAISRILDNKFSAILGRYSYSIFIVHIFVLNAFRVYLWKPYPKFVEAHLFLNIIVPVICAVLAGVAAYHLIEVPAGKYLKQKFFPQKTQA